MTRHILSVIVAAVVVCACGTEKAASPSHAPRAVQVQQWDCGDRLGQNKRTAVQALQAAQASDAEISLILAMLLQESTTGSANDRDISKDAQGAARNFSAYNMNKYCLRLLHVPDDQMESLNDDSQLGRASTIVLQGLRQLGEDKMMWLHRGGQSALEDGHSYGAQEYVAQMRAVQSTLLANRGLWTCNTRVGGHLDHV